MYIYVNYMNSLTVNITHNFNMDSFLPEADSTFKVFLFLNPILFS